MVTMIKSVCIFMMIAQAILLLVPGKVYMKYVKVLIGMLMILMLLTPLLSWFGGVEGVRGEELLKEFEAGIPENTGMWEAEKSDMGIYDGIEKELKTKLNTDISNQRYCVQEVELVGGEKEGEITIESVLITVARQKKEAETIRIEPVKLGESKTLQEEEKMRLQQVYGECLGIDAERIEISVDYG